MLIIFIARCFEETIDVSDDSVFTCFSGDGVKYFVRHCRYGPVNDFFHESNIGKDLCITFVAKFLQAPT